jgi:hypothetical protein
MAVISWQQYLDKQATQYRDQMSREKYRAAAKTLAGVLVTGVLVTTRDHYKPIVTALEYIITPPAGGPSEEAVKAALEQLRTEFESPELAAIINDTPDNEQE